MLVTSGQTLHSKRFIKKNLRQRLTEPNKCPFKHISYKLTQNSLIKQLRQTVVSQSRPTPKIHTLLTLESGLKQQIKGKVFNTIEVNPK